MTGYATDGELLFMKESLDSMRLWASEIRQGNFSARLPQTVKTEADDTDTVLEQFSVEVLIGVTSLDLLAGALLDFVQLKTTGPKEFIFLNPNDPQFVPPDASIS